MKGYIIKLLLILYLYFDPVLCVVENLGCDPGWIDGGNGYCYYAETRKRVTRNNANSDCKNKNGNLLRVVSADEMSVITNTVWPPTFAQSDGFWTDLNDLRFDGMKTSSGNYNWGSYIPLDNGTISWERYPTSLSTDACGAVNNQGKMTNWHCNRKMGYICQVKLTANSQCPLGWQPSSDTCYYVSDTTDITKIVDWTTAKQRCAGMQSQTNLTGVSLLVVDDPDDMNLVTSTIAQAVTTSVTFWTGLQKSGTTWKWYNNVLFHKDYIQWASEPDNINNNENCAIMKPDFKFADQDCSMTFNYICRRAQDTDNTQYFWGCGGWTRAGHKCYTFYDIPKVTWQSARSNCQAVGGDLLKVTSLDERHWIERKLQSSDTSSFYWSGLNDQATEGTYVWADGQLYNKSYINWNIEPNSFRGNQDCAVIRRDGPWDDRTCSLQTAFICEYQNVGGTCPQTTGWYTNTDSGECYYVSATNDTRSWFEADNYCRRTLVAGLPKPLQASLLAVNSQDELDFIKGILKNTNQPNIWEGFWTDLNDRAVEGYFAYTDKINNPPNLNLVEWKTEPYDPNGTRDCVYVTFAGRYLTIPCNAELGFVCEKYPLGYASSAEKESPFHRIVISVLCISFLFTKLL